MNEYGRDTRLIHRVMRDLGTRVTSMTYDDMCQEAAIRVERVRDKPLSIRYVAAKRAAIDFLRGWYGRRGRPPKNTIPFPEGYDVKGADDVEPTMDMGDARKFLEELRGCHPGWAEVMALSAEGRSQSEIAERLGVSASLVSYRRKRARQYLMQRLEAVQCES